MEPADGIDRPVLVLNASYEPINVCAARRALILVLKGVASAEECSPHHVRSARSAFRLPSVIRLLEYRRIPHQARALSRKNIARSLHLPILPAHFAQLGADSGSCDPAFTRRRNQLGKPGGLLPSLQQP